MQEAHGPRLVHLSEIATTDLQMLSNFFSNPVIATNERIILAVLGFEEECVVFVVVFIIIIIIIIIIISPYMGMTVNGAWSFEQVLNPVSTTGPIWNLVEIGQLICEEKVFNKTMILYLYTA